MSFVCIVWKISAVLPSDVIFPNVYCSRDVIFIPFLRFVGYICIRYRIYNGRILPLSRFWEAYVSEKPH